MNEQAFMTVPEVAEYLRLAMITVYRLAEKKDLPAFKAGGKWRFIKSEVDQWLRWRNR
jgi:excisionase family DNA binding protein